MGRFWTLFFGKFKGHKEEGDLLAQIDRTKIPQHVAIIMDGNGRWAKKRGLLRTVGHRYGVEALRQVIEAAVELKLPVMSVYAFSTENWKRPKDEVSVLMNLIVEYLQKEIKELHRQQVKIRPIGFIEDLPPAAQRELNHAQNVTAGNTGLQLNVALNYGGRLEIVHAARTLGAKIASGELKSEAVTEELFASFLFTAGQPDPDLLIRPSGEFRISNFLLWQLAYAEFYFSDINWPDFGKEEFYRAILDFQTRERRYGGI
ncbi:isoprenyl transferase [Dehalobacterium formicoaceticum]|uniref:Isoprenyl transferase n=1 Tax=Dehalobacterium formicoaceticum TaxID=51515 RepID=A0ABT1Y1F7_9FIRM|nr:isoprenyl transferase [Dehalobacterium formicoaceticum]MCR6544702.1 isoprenyl transferase [Dehalobacterium formicoaceticum]